MNKEAEVGPDFVDVFHFIMIDHHFHTHLAPGGHPDNITDIPFFGMFHNLIQFLIPVTECGNPSAGFIKSLEPEGPLTGENSTQVTCIPARFSFFQVGGTSQHQEALGHGFFIGVFVFDETDKLADIVDRIAAE